MVWDPSLSTWNNISGLTGYPAGGATLVSLAVEGNNLHVTVRGTDGVGNEIVRQTTCVIQPTPGTGGNPAWPGNCTAYTDFTPPQP
ncbi:hypothetical protein GCM10023085_10580 [Actinomadura viridis]